MGFFLGRLCYQTLLHARLQVQSILLGQNFGLKLNVDLIIFILILLNMILLLIYNAQLIIIIRVRH